MFFSLNDQITILGNAIRGSGGGAFPLDAYPLYKVKEWGDFNLALEFNKKTEVVSNNWEIYDSDFFEFDGAGRWKYTGPYDLRFNISADFMVNCSSPDADTGFYLNLQVNNTIQATRSILLRDTLVPHNLSDNVLLKTNDEIYMTVKNGTNSLALSFYQLEYKGHP